MGGIPHAGLYEPPATVPLQMVTNAHMSPLFHAAAEATEEAILNALLAAGDMMGRDGLTSYGSDSIRSMGGSGRTLGGMCSGYALPGASLFSSFTGCWLYQI
jgi:hypothetical protein